MKNLERLRILTKVLFVLFMIALIMTPGFILIHIISPRSLPPDIKISIVGDINAGSLLALLLVYTGYGLYTYALYLFRKVLDLFSKRKIFDAGVITFFRQIGKCTFYGFLLLIIPLPIYRLFTETEHEINFDFEDISYSLFTLIISFFFLVLAEVFQMAKNIKEENDLTV